MDVSGARGRIVAALMLGLAQIEWEYRRERQAAESAVARRNGVDSKSGEECDTISGIFGFGAHVAACLTFLTVKSPGDVVCPWDWTT